MTTVKAFAAPAAGKPLESFEYELPEIGRDQVDIDVEYCGVCHSDLSMIDNEWHNAVFPLVPGHEVVGRVSAVGEHVANLKVGDRVGLGWFSESCMLCQTCMGGDHNLCASAEQTIVQRHGGFADRVRCHEGWAVRLPEAIDAAKAGPLFCGGLTVFNPIDQFGIKPTDHVGVVGIGGLGHLALMFLAKWGCHVTAFTSSEGKAEQARKFGAHQIVNSRDDAAIGKAERSLDFLLVTVNVPLNWNAYLNTLKSRGRFHVVGGILEPIQVPAFSLIGRMRSVSGSPLGSPATAAKMLDFCGRHDIAPQVEEFKMSQVNDAVEHVRAGKPRYRAVLKNDL